MNTVAPPPDLIEIQALQAKLVSALRPILAEDGLLWEPEDTIPYECDGLAAYRRMPLAVALPENEAQVSRILQICHAMNIPVVPRGAGTGLSGGAMPIPMPSVSPACCSVHSRSRVPWPGSSIAVTA